MEGQFSQVIFCACAVAAGTVIPAARTNNADTAHADTCFTEIFKFSLSIIWLLSLSYRIIRRSESGDSHSNLNNKNKEGNCHEYPRETHHDQQHQ